MKQTRKERKKESKKKQQDAILAGEVLKQLDPEQERHDRMVAAVLKAGICFKQINSGQIKVHFRGERGDEVSFIKAAPTHYQLLIDAGAVDESYEFAVNRFYALWEAHRRALGAWEGKGGAEMGEDPIDELLDRQRLYSVLTRNLKPVYILNMQILSENRDSNADREKVLNYLLPLTPVWLETLKIAQGVLESLEAIAEQELQNALAQTVKF